MTREATQKDLDDAENGRQAQEILDNRYFLGAHETLKEELIAAWRNSAPDDIQGRERLYLALDVADKYIAALRGVVANGKIARNLIDKIRGGK